MCWVWKNLKHFMHVVFILYSGKYVILNPRESREGMQWYIDAGVTNKSRTVWLLSWFAISVEREMNTLWIIVLQSNSEAWVFIWLQRLEPPVFSLMDSSAGVVWRWASLESPKSPDSEARARAGRRVPLWPMDICEARGHFGAHAGRSLHLAVWLAGWA